MKFSKISLGTFVCILAVTYFLLLLDNQDSFVLNNTNFRSAKSTEEEPTEEDTKENPSSERYTENELEVRFGTKYFNPITRIHFNNVIEKFGLAASCIKTFVKLCFFILFNAR